MTTIQTHDLDTLAEKLSTLDLTEGEAVALDALLSIGATNTDDDEVSGFMLGNKFTGAGLAGSLTGSGLYSTSSAGTDLYTTSAAGTDLFSTSAAGTELFSTSSAGTEIRK